MLQIYRAGDVGDRGSAGLAATMPKPGGVVVDAPPGHAVGAGSGPAVRERLTRTPWCYGCAAPTWPRCPQPPAGPAVRTSGLMGGLEHAPLTPAVAQHGQQGLPLRPADRRRMRVDYPLAWFSDHPQGEDRRPSRCRPTPTSSCGIVSDTINHMVDTFVRDYLVERIEGMLEHRIITGYYPRLALAQNQRFASKGGYVVRFAEPKAPDIARPATGSRPRPWIGPPQQLSSAAGLACARCCCRTLRPLLDLARPAGAFMTCGGSILSSSTSNMSNEPGGMATGEFMS